MERKLEANIKSIVAISIEKDIVIKRFELMRLHVPVFGEKVFIKTGFVMNLVFVDEFHDQFHEISRDFLGRNQY